MMKSTWLIGGLTASILSLASPAAWSALIDITRPGDPISIVNGTNDGDISDGAPPAAEGVEHAIDDIGQKYLNFLDLGSGFIVTPSASIGPVVGLRIYTANDAVARDPASFEFFGANTIPTDPAGWAAIASGSLSLPDDRNPGGSTISIPPEGNFAAAFQEILFANTIEYTHYMLIFPTLKDAADANSMQVAEVELLADTTAGTPIPEPGTLALLGIGLAGALGVARKRR